MASNLTGNFFYSYDNVQQFGLPSIPNAPSSNRRHRITLPADILNSISIEEKVKVLVASNFTAKPLYKKAIESARRGVTSVSRDISHIISRQKKAYKKSLQMTDILDNQYYNKMRSNNAIIAG